MSWKQVSRFNQDTVCVGEVSFDWVYDNSSNDSWSQSGWLLRELVDTIISRMRNSSDMSDAITFIFNINKFEQESNREREGERY